MADNSQKTEDTSTEDVDTDDKNNQVRLIHPLIFSHTFNLLFHCL